MSISPVSPINLYQEQTDFYKRLMYEDNASINNALIKNGIIPGADAAKNAAKLQQINKDNSIQNSQSTQSTTNTITTEDTTDKPWYTIMYQLGLSPSGDVETDYRDIIDEIVKRLENAKDEDEFNKYLWLQSFAQDVFINAGVSISNIQGNTMPFGTELEMLSNYNKPVIENGQKS